MCESLFVKCKKCKNVCERTQLINDNYICSFCNYYKTLDCNQRINLITDKDSFEEINSNTKFNNPIKFPGYREKHEQIFSKTNLSEAIITGKAKIKGNKIMIGVMDTRYMMGSMGVIEGEKITRLFEEAGEEELPVILIIASGGARMQEGIFSLMQMVKTTAAVSKFSSKGGLYISVLTNPTTGGVSASFALLADIILAEPKALIGFAGKRVIEQTMHEELPQIGRASCRERV